MRERIRENIKKSIDEQRGFFIKIADYTISHVWRSIITLIILVLLTLTFSFVDRLLFLVFSTMLAIYAVIIAVSLFRHGLKYLFNS